MGNRLSRPKRSSGKLTIPMTHNVTSVVAPANNPPSGPYLRSPTELLATSSVSSRSSSFARLQDLSTNDAQGPTIHAAKRPSTLQHSPMPAVHPEAHIPPHAAMDAYPLNPGQYPAHQPITWSQHQAGREGSFQGAHDFVMNNPVMNDINIHNHGNVMEKLLKESIPGAAFDSSARDPPPRCHPGTRLAIVGRTQYFIANCSGMKRMRWIVGPAGVGKSAIVQTVAESQFTDAPHVVLGGSIFFSFKGRSDGSKAITTLAYQLAAKYTAYRQFIQTEITNDPSLLSASVAVQFKKFIIEPFVRFLNLHDPCFVILIDGLDECDKHHDQCELLRLISDFCITYPASPLVWIIASRPEPHITSFFSRAKVTPAYEKEEIEIDAKQACDDVERFLRNELKEIQMKSPALQDLRQWPKEGDFLKLADASKGLFAHASTVVKFIDDPAYGNPVLQLEQVLDVIDTNSKWLVKGKSHPMALLDGLYDRILSRVPTDVMANTRKLLLLMINYPHFLSNMVMVCNWLGMTKDTAYGATHHLRSVLDVPAPHEAHRKKLECFHKSFIDYLKDFERSNFCSDIRSATWELHSFCARRILEQAPNGTLEDGTGTVATILLSWPHNKNEVMRVNIYGFAAYQTIEGLRERIPAFQDPCFIRALAAFNSSPASYYDLRSLLFDESWRSELLEHDVLKQIPVRTLNSSNFIKDRPVEYRFRCPAPIMAKIPDPWNPACKHGRRGNYEEGEDQGWKSRFRLGEKCGCPKRFFNHWKNQRPDDLVTVFIPLDLDNEGLIEYQFVDLENGVAEWMYIIPYHFPRYNVV